MILEPARGGSGVLISILVTTTDVSTFLEGKRVGDSVGVNRDWAAKIRLASHSYSGGGATAIWTWASLIGIRPTVGSATAESQLPTKTFAFVFAEV